MMLRFFLLLVSVVFFLSSCHDHSKNKFVKIEEREGAFSISWSDVFKGYPAKNLLVHGKSVFLFLTNEKKIVRYDSLQKKYYSKGVDRGILCDFGADDDYLYVFFSDDNNMLFLHKYDKELKELLRERIDNIKCESYPENTHGYTENDYVSVATLPMKEKGGLVEYQYSKNDGKLRNSRVIMTLQVLPFKSTTLANEKYYVVSGNEKDGYVFSSGGRGEEKHSEAKAFPYDIYEIKNCGSDVTYALANSGSEAHVLLIGKDGAILKDVIIGNPAWNELIKCKGAHALIKGLTLKNKYEHGISPASIAFIGSYILLMNDKGDVVTKKDFPDGLERYIDSAGLTYSLERNCHGVKDLPQIKCDVSVTVEKFASL